MFRAHLLLLFFIAIGVFRGYAGANSETPVADLLFKEAEQWKRFIQITDDAWKFLDLKSYGDIWVAVAYDDNEHSIGVFWYPVEKIDADSYFDYSYEIRDHGGTKATGNRKIDNNSLTQVVRIRSNGKYKSLIWPMGFEVPLRRDIQKEMIRINATLAGTDIQLEVEVPKAN